MRLHHLEITAFGPFAETVAVDFDELSGGGLFLLSGPTGAGKTSVLDAVCFALYGEVPGDRGQARRLRCDQATPGLAPRVRLEATLAGRRFRVVRSPAWVRPKKRGTGLTTEQPSVVLAERVGGEWVTLATRLDEAGYLVGQLLGMSLAQFTQVALLPQGRFQAFLRARSEDRQRLLQQLFRTGRFEDVERWLRDRHSTLRRASQTVQDEVADLVSRVSETVEEPSPAQWLLDGAGAVGEGLAGWTARLRDEATGAQAVAETEASRAAEHERVARTELEAGRELAARIDRLVAARAEHEQLLGREEEIAALAAALGAAGRAAPVLPLHRLTTTTSRACADARAEADDAGRRAATALGLPMVDRSALDAAVDDATAAAAAARATLPRAATLEQLTGTIDDCLAEREELASRITAVDAASATMPAQLERLRAVRIEVTLAADRIPGCEARRDRIRARLAAHDQLTSLEESLATATVELDRARAATLLHWEELLSLRQQRLDGMAAEIAGALVVGGCCPVCGSAEHPAKARPAPDAPDAQTERAALKRLDDSKALEHAHAEFVRDLVVRLAPVRGLVGHDPREQLDAEAREVDEELARLRALADSAAASDRALTAAEQEAERLGEELGSLRAQWASADADLAARRKQAAALRAEIDDLLAGTGRDDLPALHRHHLERAESGRAAVAALDRLTAADDTHRDATAALLAAVKDAGFDDVEQALAATLAPARVGALTELLREHERRLAVVRDVLGAPDAPELAATERPAPESLRATHAETVARLTDTTAAAARWGRRRERLDELGQALDAALTAWQPVRRDLAVVSELAAFVEGKSADNRLQMRLSAYVLTYRLGQVVAAANLRLARMSDQRYSLEHTGRRGTGESRGGLSLLVRDDWSGEPRDPATLSGGETFVVSLALALGLADVVTQEAGGADLDTLFVDEGFGSLDADTLDDVMDTLDTLRDGGRVVGVVSHVAEMRDRIPTQLVIGKSRTGSTAVIRR